MSKMPLPKQVGFQRDQAGVLRVDGIPLDKVADEFGTPLFVYSAAAMKDAWDRLARAFLRPGRSIHYAIKANSNLAVLSFFKKLGAGVDIVSLGELRRVQASGIAGKDIIFSGVGKTEDELHAAITAGVGQINAESKREIDMLIAIGKKLAKEGVKPAVAIRVNTDTDVKEDGKAPKISENVYDSSWAADDSAGAGGEVDTDFILTDGATRERRNISTIGRGSKFGIDIPLVEECYRRLAESGVITLKGLGVHIGSQIMDAGQFSRHWREVRNLADSLKKQGFAVPGIDLGGGIGVDYKTGETMDLQAYAASVDEIFAGTDYQICCEPGRALVAEAGCLLTQIIRIKNEVDGKRFIIVDGGMNDFIRPVLYQAYHHIEPAQIPKGTILEDEFDVVGPICETGDYLARNFSLPYQIKSGDRLAIMSAGAYGAVMRSRYNSRVFASEVMVIDGKAYAVSKPDSIEAMLAADIIPPPLVPAPAV